VLAVVLAKRRCWESSRLCGVLLGVALRTGLVGLVSQTINDLYSW